MSKINVLLLGLVLLWVVDVSAQSCGWNRQFSVPAGVSSPGEYAVSIGTTFVELQKLNMGLTDRNFRAGASICVPIKRDAYWASLQVNKQEWEDNLTVKDTTITTLTNSNDSMKFELGAKQLVFYLSLGGAFLCFFLCIGLFRKIYELKHGRQRKSLLNPGIFDQVVGLFRRERHPRLLSKLPK